MSLNLAFFVEATGLGSLVIFLNFTPKDIDSLSCLGRHRQYIIMTRVPRSSNKVQSLFVFTCCFSRKVFCFAISFIYNQQVCSLNNALFAPLQLIPTSWSENQQKQVTALSQFSLRLPYSNSFNDGELKPSKFTKQLGIVSVGLTFGFDCPKASLEENGRNKSRERGDYPPAYLRENRKKEMV